jgi:hypothetical protein
MLASMAGKAIVRGALKMERSQDSGGEAWERKSIQVMGQEVM